MYPERVTVAFVRRGFVLSSIGHLIHRSAADEVPVTETQKKTVFSGGETFLFIGKARRNGKKYCEQIVNYDFLWKKLLQK
ncbi:MAG: hypothetical protein MJ070_03410 [Lachnospiraceae bacterium]|nr:hypothetical protein [Lachnospiraceae bacterium]